MSRKPMVIGLMLLGLTGCGDDKKDKKDDGNSLACEEKCTGKGLVAKATGKTISIDFADSKAGAEYVVMPFALGDPATVQGSTSALKINFTAKLETGEAAGLVDLSPKAQTALGGDNADPIAFDHTLRTLANRFDPSKGQDQGPGFWAMARHADATSGSFLTSEAVGPMQSVESFYRNAANKAVAAAKPAGVTEAALTTVTTAAACPSGTVKRPSDTLTPIDHPITAAQVVDGTDFCLVYIDEPTTVESKDAIKAALTTIMKNYKDVVYKDKFEGGADGFAFKPVVVIVDVGDDSNWAQAAVLNLAGVYLGAMSDAAKLPMLYMASDYDQVKSMAGTDAAYKQAYFHSVLAHEMQHAVLDWFRDRDGQGSKAPEGAALDEGLAHLMEGVHGYGADVQKKWAAGFLSGFSFGSAPFLASEGDKELADVALVETFRGGPHTLLFYLASQKGGVKVEGGKVTGGGGLEFITAFAKSSKAGPAALAEAMGGEWVDHVGNYLGAIAMDNVKLADPISDQFKTQGIVTGVKNLQGADGQYGMVFNETGASRTGDYEQKITEGAKDLKLYQTKPLLYKVEDPTKKLVFTVDQELKNTAVTVVRIK